jgi:DNA-directed RNA polymerase subunit RPC12/RpoP
MTEAYCIRCKKKVAMKNEREALAKHGQKMKRGECPTCGYPVFHAEK